MDIQKGQQVAWCLPTGEVGTGTVKVCWTRVLLVKTIEGKHVALDRSRCEIWPVARCSIPR